MRSLALTEKKKARTFGFGPRDSPMVKVAWVALKVNFLLGMIDRWRVAAISNRRDAVRRVVK